MGWRAKRVNLMATFRHSETVKRPFLIGLALLGARSAHADMAWNFLAEDVRPGSNGGIYAYVYPKQGAGRTESHAATLQREVVGGVPNAKLRFNLDGTKYPSAGFGLMFPEAKALDMSGIQAIRLHLSSDSPRQVRLSLASADSAFRNASDTGVSLGIDTVVTREGVDWVIPRSSLRWPPWAGTSPGAAADVFRSTFAIQLNVTCESTAGKPGACSNDSGWVVLDSLRIVGQVGAWPAPPQGSLCGGDSVDVSRFGDDSPKRNGFGGWWYTFTDRSSQNEEAKGASQVYSVFDPDTALAGAWRPDSLGERAYVWFHLRREAVYSGFIGLETQFGEPVDDKTAPYTMPDLAAISFDLEFGAFPSALGGISFHVKKAGRYFENGQEHQIRLPYDSVPKRWCIDLDKLTQPVKPSLRFEPESLLTMSWEVKLQGVESSAVGEFSIRNVRAHQKPRPGVVWAPRSRRVDVRRIAEGILVERPERGMEAQIALVDVQGRVLERARLPAGTTQALLKVKYAGLAWVSYQDSRGRQSFPVAP